MLSHPLLPKLKKLKLSGMLETLELRAETAREETQSPLEFLALLLDDEIDRREQGRLRRRIKEAGLEEGKTLARFDFAAAPRVPKNLLADLAFCRFVERSENVLFVGPTGTGKSHLAQALAYEAIKRGRRVLYRPVHTILAGLHAARADGTYPRHRARLLNVDVLILDDFGLVPLSPQGVEDLYEIIRERYEERSILVTSNRAPEEWAEVFGNALLASAALDRLTHHAHIITLSGESYRQRQRKKRKSSDPPQPNTPVEGRKEEARKEGM
jgi:DNA replication protein DnaC